MPTSTRFSVSTVMLPVLSFIMLFELVGCQLPLAPPPSACQDLYRKSFRYDSSSSSDSPPPPGYRNDQISGDQRTADDLLRKGVNRYNDGDLRGAVIILGKSYLYRPSKYSVLYAAGSFQYLGCISEAIVLYRKAMTQFSTQLLPEEQVSASTFLLKYDPVAIAHQQSEQDALESKRRADAAAQQAWREQEERRQQAAEAEKRSNDAIKEAKRAATRTSSAIFDWFVNNIQTSLISRDDHRAECENLVGTVVPCDSAAAHKKYDYITSSATATVRNNTNTEIRCELLVHGFGTDSSSGEEVIKKATKKFAVRTKEYLPVSLFRYESTSLIKCEVMRSEVPGVLMGDLSLANRGGNYGPYEDMIYQHGRWGDPTAP